MSDIRVITRQRIIESLDSELWPLYGENQIAKIADTVMDGLDKLLEEQEGFVPVENEPSGGNSILPKTVSVEMQADKVLAPTCPDCGGQGFHRTDPLFGAIPHHDICESCKGKGTT